MARRLVRKAGKVVGLICLPIAFLDGIGQPALVQGTSMEPTLKGNSSKWYNNDIVWLRKQFIRPHEGDIFVFISPRNERERLIKRVVAEPGERVHWKDSTRFTVPLHHYWVKADNPKCAIDSTYFGAVNIGLMEGKATHVIWPPSRWRKL
ncbi:unnamed protein product [Bursaphelenchus okinawaensis]|uniref:Mitochondrial inner membrane protease subunit 2 n=1 Tax=Bursaphelenchus okinawaensis TaxID=465554 RepID=A0A811KA66_9BILA|nr:unnamed protein product [Bursaphelenchus okinawaensis]CAG9095766.1 unnamed protein product [Bursaphelenchus okinawaensis]